MLSAVNQMLGAPHPFARWTTHRRAGGSQVDIRVWESASGCAATTQDAWVVADVGANRLRLAALDGITPTRETASEHGLDGAAWAARFTAAILASPIPVRDALIDANRALVGRFGAARLRDRPHTMAAVAEIGASAIEFTVVGDCQAFVAANGGWSELFGGPLFDANTRARWARWRADHPGADPVDDIADGYDEILASPQAWRSTPIGLYAQPHFEHVSIDRQDCDAVVVASDGARLTDERVVELDGWLEGLRAREEHEHAHEYKPHDDVVVIAASMSTGR